MIVIDEPEFSAIELADAANDTVESVVVSVMVIVSDCVPLSVASAPLTDDIPVSYTHLTLPTILLV